MSHKPYCPVPVISYNDNLVLEAAKKYPKVAARLPDNYLTETTTLLGKIPADLTGQKIAKGETGNLTKAQQANLDALLHSMGQARLPRSDRETASGVFKSAITIRRN